MGVISARPAGNGIFAGTPAIERVSLKDGTGPTRCQAVARFRTCFGTPVSEFIHRCRGGDG